MLTEKAIRDLLDQVKLYIDAELDLPADDPIKQWARLKAHQAEKNILEQVLE